MKNTTLCPCSSGKQYQQCCKPFHQGQLPATALELMRSRFSAYALGLPDYIIQTTHPGSHQFKHDLDQWTKDISNFSSNTEFKKLEILQFHENNRFATVTFVAHLTQMDKDASFTERSHFEKVKGKWLYHSGQLAEGHAPNLITTNQPRLLPLAYLGQPILRKVADPVTSVTDDIRTLVEEMIETMDGYNGIGIAAPQVHHSIKLFLIRKPIEIQEGELDFQDVKVLINPVLSDPSKETWKAIEACLSIPSIQAEVERPREITVEYTDLEGNRRKERAAGWEARAIMHENDHINGILYIDRLSPEERQSLDPFLKSLENRIHAGMEM